MAAFWQAKVSGTYTDMLTPTTYQIDWEDYLKDSFRSINSGNMIDTIISQSWTTANFEFNRLTASEINTLLAVLDDDPIYVKIPNVNFSSSGTTEMVCRCVKKSAGMTVDGDYNLSFSLVETTRSV